MLQTDKLEALKTAAMSSDWAASGEVFIDLGLGADTAAARFTVETIAHSVRLRDSDALSGLIDQILSEGRA